MSSVNVNTEDAAKPLPRRAFDLNTPTSTPSTPASEQHSFSTVQNGRPNGDGATTPARTRSILNLTSSTLFGIYRDTDYTTEKEEPSTPWGTGAQTPVDGRRSSIEMLRNSIPDAFSRASKDSRPKRKDLAATRKRPHHVRKGFRGYWLPVIGTTVALFAVGVLYGLLVSHLHNRDDVAPVKVEGIDHGAWEYLVLWGLAGIVLGYTLPAVDSFWYSTEEERAERTGRGSGGWNDVVRSIGAFVGVAFAIRKLPWQSTLQLSLTLALANPAVWYLIDRSVPGFIVSAANAFTGTAVCLLVNPGLVPPPSTGTRLPTHIVKRMGTNSTAPIAHDASNLVLGFFSEESVGVATWIASVLFVSAVCFGNIGRRLASQK
ncbi:hypothetical protein AMS68_006437 [Peltaster fructicola]|uniref:Uncharacterized protein n=1 Tax=Peltaster fructicola TaxID=286661 RepID=A0A6H0Y2Q7_9PEZI|nr:hypothetical protein AMS68_006437 [Peltaster fructicola]